MGEKLLQDVATATGLPEDLISDELLRLIAKDGKCPTNLTLEDLRMILAEYVQDVLLQAKMEFNEAAEG